MRLNCVRAAGAVYLFAVAGTGIAVGRTGFTPVSELPGVVEPPVGVIPVNAGQVISGLAPRYVVQRAMTTPGGHLRTAVTADFLSYVDMPYTPDLNGDVLTGVADDGHRVVVTLTSVNSSTTRRIAYWEPGSQPVVLNLDSQFNQYAGGMSADGRWIAGSTGVSSASRAWIVDTQGAAAVIDSNGEGGGESVSQCMSSDGAWVAGVTGGAPGPRFLWSAATGNQYLDSGLVHKPLPVFMSEGARVMVCGPETVNNKTIVPVRIDGRWRHLGLGETAPSIDFLRRDGAMAGGSRNNLAVLWTPTLGVVDCVNELHARGVSTGSWSLTHVWYCSPDGRTLVGTGRPPGVLQDRWWVAHVDPFAAADIGKAGGAAGGDAKLDNNDFIVFIDRFFAQDERADVGKAGAERGGDGLLDNNDFAVFIDLFFSGEP